jgi:agmatinase
MTTPDSPQAAAAPIGPKDGQVSPRYAGLATFARLPRAEDVAGARISVLGVPYDSGVTYRPGARFGPAAIREASRLLKPYNPELDALPYSRVQVADAGDVDCNPFKVDEAVSQIEEGVSRAIRDGNRAVILGGDHSLALPALRAVHSQYGPVALVHFDAHLDTWDTYFDAPYTHGTPFRRASEEGLIRKDRSVHVGIRGSLYDVQDLVDDERLGFTIIRSRDLDDLGLNGVLSRITDRVGDAPVYVSVDIDVLDPAFAPGTGTPEMGGLSSRELLALIRGLKDLPILSADIVETAPAYDTSGITATAAATLAYEFISIMAEQLA